MNIKYLKEYFIIKIFIQFEERRLRIVFLFSWKDQKCPFRTDSRTKLNVLPTLTKWGTQKRLEGDDCLKDELVEMLVTDEED